MALIIKADMPKNCATCPCVCLDWQEWEDWENTPNPNCKIILTKIPDEHGRLIDADAIENSLGIEDEDIYVKYTLDEAPTVLEASR